MTPTPILKFHPSAPQKLIDLYQKLGTLRAVEKTRKINKKFIYNLLVYGIAPADRDKRRALFLPVEPLRKKPSRKDLPAYLNWWWNQSKETRRQVMKDAFEKTIKESE